jgi:hypothetical protein
VVNKLEQYLEIHNDKWLELSSEYHKNIEDYKNFPIVRYAEVDFKLLNDFHNWFIENNINYELILFDFCICIKFKNMEELILFKLTWI